MAKLVRLSLPKRPELNYDFDSFNSFVLRNIKSGYKNKAGQYFLDQNFDDVDVENDYLLQHATELLNSKIGWCFDLVELYREYAFTHKLSSHSYFLEYYDEAKHIHFVSAFILIQQRDGKWYECADNLQTDFGGAQVFASTREAVSKCFYDFKHYVKEVVDNPKREYFYMNEYPLPEKEVFDGKLEITDWCRIEQLRPKEERKEVSSMAIVFAKGEAEDQYYVLLLKTNHNEWVFPKGHIEGKESSKDAAIRECYEEAHVNIKKASYLGYVDKYKYRFDSYDLEMTKEMFYEIFTTNAIEKRVEVHAFYREKTEPVIWLEEENFIDGSWIDVNDALKVISFTNTLELYRKAYSKFARKYLKKNKLNDVIQDVIKPFKKNKRG